MTQQVKEFMRSYFHGTQAELKVGDYIVAGNHSNYEQGRNSKYAYFTSNLTVAIWGAELAVGASEGKIYVAEATGEVEDDPNVTNKRFAGNPTNSFRTKGPLKVIGTVTDWQGHTVQEIEARKEGIRKLMESGAQIIED